MTNNLIHEVAVETDELLTNLGRALRSGELSREDYNDLLRQALNNAADAAGFATMEEIERSLT